MQSNLQQTQPPAMPEEIELTLLLTGGHQYTLPIQTDAPLLRQLFEAVVDSQQQYANTLFQVPIRQGQAVVCFRGNQLVGLITEPPLIIQQQQQQQQQPAQPANRNALQSSYVQLENFLTPDQLDRLLQFTLEQEAEFVPTTTSTGEQDYRKSVVLHHFPEFSELLSQRIREVLPYVMGRLNLTPFAIAQIEAQLTAHNDGHYYKVHNDNGSSETATRELTYVYYFNQEPRAYAGGELVIYDSKIENNYYVQADTYKAVEPRNNSIVFFPSYYMHEVLPIQCPSKKFVDSRFTINGWIRRQ